MSLGCLCYAGAGQGHCIMNTVDPSPSHSCIPVLWSLARHRAKAMRQKLAYYFTLLTLVRMIVSSAATGSKVKDLFAASFPAGNNSKGA